MPLETVPVTALDSVTCVPLVTVTVVLAGIFALPVTVLPFGIAAVVLNVKVVPLVVVALVLTVAVGFCVIV